MIQKSPIEWTDYTSNPIKYRDKATGKVVWGCVRKSPGCAHCYAADLAKRYGKGGLFTEAEMAGLECFLDEKELKALLSPRRLPAGSKVFVGDMTDIFGPWVPFEFLDRVLAVFALRPDVTFQVLTKRPERMREYICAPNRAARIDVTAAGIVHGVASVDVEWFVQSVAADASYHPGWPLPNVWMGTSVENQRWADTRIPELLATPAAVRFLSCEPLLGPLNITHIRAPDDYEYFPLTGMEAPEPRLHWVICGGESGPKARAMDIAWARSLRDQCQAAGVAVFVKQLGAKPYGRQSGVLSWPDYPLRDRKGGSMEEWPADLRVREFPNELSAVSSQPSAEGAVRG